MGPVVDAETGFQYLRARYYDPATGQFLTRDPIEAVTREPYGYVGGNPLNATDPLGLFCVGSLCTPKVVGDVLGGAWDATGGKAVTYAADHPRQVLTGAAIALGTVATVASVGALAAPTAALFATYSSVATYAGSAALALDAGFVGYDCVLAGNGSCGQSALALGVDAVSLGGARALPRLLGARPGSRQFRALQAYGNFAWNLSGLGANLSLLADWDC